jgi:hypothetical protein
LQLGQRHIRRLLNLRHKELGMYLDPSRAPVAALGLGENIPPYMPDPNPADRTRHPGTKTGRRLPPRDSRLNRLDNTNTKIVRQTFPHSCWPP